jgi:hypothetical protein
MVVVEGEKKALALFRLASHNSESPRFIPIAIPGVWNWRGTVGKTTGPNGERVDVKGPIPDLNLVEWGGRKVSILFDSNVHSNDSVKFARTGLARELAGRSADENFINLPEDCGVNGVDDLLVAWGPEGVLELFDKPVRGVRLQVGFSAQYKSTPEGMFREFLKGEQLVRTQLTNFQARIDTSLLVDDGVEAKREFEIAAELSGRRFRFTIPAAIQRNGLGDPANGDRSHHPTASEGICADRNTVRFIECHRTVRLCAYWLEEGKWWVYLHGQGAIGARGSVEGIRVRLSEKLQRYELGLPKDQAALVSGVRASLKTLDIAPPQVSFPLRAATCRAVFGDTDFSVHLAGGSGAQKSELAALEQQHFGSEMIRKRLQAHWSSTGNALEELAFQAKDALLVIDDFVPRGTPVDVARYHAAAERLFRAVGNGAGRGRLDSACKLREARPPRAAILSTGEDIPFGHSLQARVVMLELKVGDVDLTMLTECQRDAEAGLYGEAMGAFVRWLAARYEERQQQLCSRARDIRAMLQRSFTHARTPDIIGNLQAAFEIYIQFVEECGVITNDQRNELIGRCWQSLTAVAASQAVQQSESEPAGRFIALLRACLASGKGHLAARDGGIPAWAPESCGWRRDGSGIMSPRGDCVGWIDGEQIYVEPIAAHHCVLQLTRDTSETLPESLSTLNKRLREKGLLASIEASRGTMTIRRTICGSEKHVLHFRRSTILPDASNEE